MMIIENKEQSVMTTTDDMIPPTLIENNSLGDDQNLADYETNMSNTSASNNDIEDLDQCHLLLFPKKAPVIDDQVCLKFLSKLPTLSGEYAQFVGLSGKMNNDRLIITNYRLFMLDHDYASFVNVPLMLIESIEVKEIIFVYIHLKIAKTIRLTFNSSEKTLLWASRLNTILSDPSKLELFAFAFYWWHMKENTDETTPISDRFLFAKSDQTNLVFKEFKRMEFDRKLWRVSEVNKKFDVCPTYPEYLIVPKSITDEQLKKISAFRSYKRFPSVVWRSKKNGAVIARSSQPNVGLWVRRLNEDELLLRAMAEAVSCSSTVSTNSSSTTSSTTSSVTNAPSETSSMLLIIDARFSSVALANRVKGGGYEYSEYYTNCEIQFMNLENIHVIRSSFQSLRLLCQFTNDNRTVLSQLENTKWLNHISGILKAACTVTSAIDQCGKPVLIHCSDGWDRTPQILALAKLLLDPYYRTISGFRTLVEIEWLAFGHKFAQRNGHSANNNDTNERCPVFLQWLDCVYQITRQFPSAFQFNEIFLLKLCYHSYSCLFGTFLCDSANERVNQTTYERTYSIWSYLNEKNAQIINHLYDDSFDEVLYPVYEIVNLQLWQRLFCEPELIYLVKVGGGRQEASPGSSVATAAASAPNFNDSLDGVYNGSSPLEQQIKQIIQDDLELDMKLNNNSNTPQQMHSSSSMSLTWSTQQQTQNDPMQASITRARSTTGGAQLRPKILRSYDDLSKLNNHSNKFKIDFDTNLAGEYHYNRPAIHDTNPQARSNNATTNEDSTTSSPYFNSTGDPIPTRRCSEPNLLLDALNCASPKLSTNSIIFNYPPISTTESSSEQAAASEEVPETPSCTPEIEPDQQRMTQSLVNMQTSTDTLVDEVLLSRKLAAAAIASRGLGGGHTRDLLIQRPFVDAEVSSGGTLSPAAAAADFTSDETTNHDLMINNNNNNNNNIRQPLHVVSHSSTESSTSSTIPSPSGVDPTKPSPLVASNSVSTSTSGLFDYVQNSPRFPKNEKLKLLVEPSELLTDELNKLNHQGWPNGAHSTAYASSKCRVSSSSIPIKNRKHADNGAAATNISTCPSTASGKKQKKTIRDFIDVDGLTKIEDRTFRKIIEREEKYQREISTLKEKLSRYNMIFNKIASNPGWHEAPTDFPATEFLDSSQSDENQSNCCYSLSNESFCSSWDEIDESDYKLAAWVPDYYVTHCQGCNDKFTIRLRKHHCRSCGQVFCYKCADNFCPLPNLNLTAPVRVCRPCKLIIEQRQQHGHNQPLKPVSNGAGGVHSQRVNGSSMFSSAAATAAPSDSTTNGLTKSSTSRLFSGNGQSIPISGMPKWGSTLPEGSNLSAAGTNLINSCNFQAADPSGKYKNVNKSDNKSQKVFV